MAETADRDARRWAAYERLAADPSASPSERKQARDRIADLRARYPHGRPRPPGERRYAHGWGRAAGGYGYAYEPPPPPPPVDPSVVAARAAAERAAREEAVRAQRANVERVPKWEGSYTLRELHAAPNPWSADDHQRFKEQRARMTGSSRAVDL